jgi:hypothetical protein
LLIESSNLPFPITSWLSSFFLSSPSAPFIHAAAEVYGRRPPCLSTAVLQPHPPSIPPRRRGPQVTNQMRCRCGSWDARAADALRARSSPPLKNTAPSDFPAHGTQNWPPLLLHADDTSRSAATVAPCWWEKSGESIALREGSTPAPPSVWTSVLSSTGLFSTCHNFFLHILQRMDLVIMFQSHISSNRELLSCTCFIFN